MVLYNEILVNIVTTITNIIVIVVIASLSFYLLKKRAKSNRQVKKLKSRTIYISIVIFFLALIKIWIGGIGHLFTMLSLVAAGLIIINKETVMNFVGWIIINWRSLFSEGDYIQIQSYHGYITEIKLFYFRMYETVDHGDKKTTGKLLKLPNALVITSPISTFTSDDSIILHKIPFLANTDKNVLEIAEKANNIINEIVTDKYHFNKDFSKSTVINKSKLKHCEIYDFKPDIEIKTLIDKENTVNIQANFYCYINDKKDIEQLYITELLKQIKPSISSSL
ncbi:mechanosensitive ion channel domain-containing protein [Francisella sp. 19X1-34]|uniref:mechanosensitive ion channel domain-containing protein n=1 Tax=Francisella sp. 19X1-34 TaxID=3087177 RepID=UPI002E33962E|nr:mechanosensitive ion channel domain-containing protein [Francisella sp. 19X1-34]MED7789062.1 mechanosensitive ion channel [Francisella sp. 19X1-34]